MNNSFSPGIEVYYKSYLGKIRFVCESYTTVCVSLGEHKSNDVCLIVYPEDYKFITLAKESEK